MSTLPTAAATPLLRCVGLERVYPDGAVNALRSLDLTIAQGEYVAIMGPSGSGKSTLLNLLGGLDLPTAGEIFLRGEPLTNKLRNSMRINTVGFVFQAFHLLPTLTACENVQIPMFETSLPAAARQAKAIKLLEQVGLGQRLQHLPVQLSGGERQRVAIARALANDPVLLLADEPTGNLDSKTGHEVLDLFEKLHRERNLTLLIVTHSPEVGERASRLIRLRDGSIVEDTKRAAR